MRYYRGILLMHLTKELFDTDDRKMAERLHIALKKRFGVESTSSLTHEELKAYTRDIRTAMSTEWGILSPLPGDPSNIDDMDMKDFIKLTLEYGKNERATNNHIR